MFRPGKGVLEEKMLRWAMGSLRSPYGCSEGCVVYRTAAAGADHYYFINDGEPREVVLDTRGFRYRGVSDPVSGERLEMGKPIALEGYSARWVRFVK